MKGLILRELSDTNKNNIRGVIIIITIIMLAGCSPQMNKNNFIASKDFPSQVHNFKVVKFISLNVGWVAGKGSILKTINGGNTWRVVYSGNQDILQIDAVNKKYEVAVTPTGLLYSRNEGDNWNYKNYDFSSSQRQIKQVDLSGDHTAYLLSDGIVSQVWRQNFPTSVVARV